jgi:hypothetical protein
MNSDRRIPFKTVALLSMLIASGLIVSACGGESGSESSQSAGIGGTGINVGKGVVQGRVTGFGSIYVNGVKFDTDSSQFIVDGEVKANQMESNLKVGMVVSLEVETEDGSYTGNALQVVYDDEVQGPVSGLKDVDGSGGAQKTFKVFGETVIIDEAQTIFDGRSFATLADGEVVEISGFRTSPTEISASYVEFIETVADGSEIELRGIVNDYMPPVQAFTLNEFAVTFDPNTEIEVSGGLAGLSNGVYVEVKGEYRTTGPSVHATEIEEEDEGLGDDVDDVSLQGIISVFESIDDFKIDNQQIDASQAGLSLAEAELLANGVEVEVEGNIVGGVLLADELELRQSEAKLKSFVSFIYPDNTRFEISYTGLTGSVEVITDSQTLFDDEGPLTLEDFSVANMNLGDFVIVEGAESNDKVTAEIVKRLDSADPGESELGGQVDSFVPNVSITVLGIPFKVDTTGAFTDTDYKDDIGSITEAVFFGKLAIGDQVEITDEVIADGFAEEVKLDD